MKLCNPMIQITAVLISFFIVVGVSSADDFDRDVDNDGDMMGVLDVLAREVGIIGIFSDWPATVSYYANCMGMKGKHNDFDEDDDD